jgi:acyl-CoA hydrolase/GNAT superfamily N-acetyltransferase
MKPLCETDWPRIVRPGSRVFLGGGASVPQALIRSLLKSAERLRDVEVVHIHGLGETPWIDPQYADVVRTNSFFLTPSIRDAVERGQADYTPCPMSEVAMLFESGPLPIDVALIQVSPPDKAGNCTLGVSVDVVRAAVRSARVIVAQINPQMPRTCGDTIISTRKIDWFIEHSAALPESEKVELDERHQRIGRYAAQLVEDGSTLQIGLGRGPEAVARALRNHKHLGLHTGYFSDALMDLMKRGVVDGSMKSYLPGRIIASHVLGSRKLYRFVDGNEDIELRASEWVNDPGRISRNDRMVSVNSARQIDLTGQVVRDTSGHRFHGGIGALQDFIRGAGRSRGGRPIVALPSTSDENGESQIVAGLESDSGVCTGRGDVHYVVTEFGVASLHGRSIRERVARLVEIAHPDHREALLAGAHGRGWLPKFFTMPATDAEVAKDGVESSWVKFGKVRLLMRPLHPSDMRGLQEFFYSHDDETVRLRYGYRRDRMTGESAYKLAAVDQRKDLALGLFEESHGREELRAIGRYYLDGDGKRAEVAFVVHETMRGLGLGAYLMSELATVALRRKVTSFWASVMADNVAMARVFRAVGGESDAGDGEDEKIFEMELERIVRDQPVLLKRKNIRPEKR